MRRVCVPLLAIALLAGCSGDPPRDTAIGAVDAAIEASRDAKSARWTVRLDSDFGGETLQMEGEAITAADNSRGRFKGRFGEGGAMQPMEFISVGDDWWFRGGPFDELIPADKRWLHMRQAAVTSMTPSEFLTFLRESDGLEEVGTETVHGEPTTHVRGQVDVRRLAESTDSAAAEQLAETPQAGEMEMVVDVWIAEDDDLMSRMALSLTHPDAPGELRIEGDMLDYGVSLDAARAPPKDQVEESGLEG